MQNRDRAFQIARKGEAGRLGSDPGTCLFVEILAREAVRSLITSEGAQPRMCKGPGALTKSKGLSPAVEPTVVAQGPGEPPTSRLSNTTEGNARLLAASQGRLFD